MHVNEAANILSRADLGLVDGLLTIAACERLKQQYEFCGKELSNSEQYPQMHDFLKGRLEQARLAYQVICELSPRFLCEYCESVLTCDFLADDTDKMVCRSCMANQPPA